MPSKPRRRFRAPTGYEAFAITLAFLALGSGSYAAVTVTGKNVKNSSLTGRDVKNNSLTGKDVKGIKTGDVSNGSLLTKDFKAGQLPAGPQGQKGETGPTFGAIRVTDPGVAVPDSPPDSVGVFEDTSFTTPSGGKLLAFAQLAQVRVLCQPTADGSVGLYIDDKPVPGTKRSFTNFTFSEYDVIGMLGGFAAGPHTLKPTATCNGASTPSSIESSSEHSVGAVLLGG